MFKLKRYILIQKKIIISFVLIIMNLFFGFLIWGPKNNSEAQTTCVEIWQQGMWCGEAHYDGLPPNNAANNYGAVNCVYTGVSYNPNADLPGPHCPPGFTHIWFDMAYGGSDPVGTCIKN